MEKYGFVYIWYDRKHKRYYVGSHWGLEDDGYICSSSWMNQAYKKRPNDFKRRILQRINTTRQELLETEYKWLKLIKPEEIKIKYYNLNIKATGHWSANSEKQISISEKISNTIRNKHLDPEYRKKYEEGLAVRNNRSSDPDVREKRRKSMIGKNKGKVHQKSLEAAWAARRGSSISEDHKQKIKEAGVFKKLNNTKIKCMYCETIGNPGNIARYHNDRCKNKGL